MVAVGLREKEVKLHDEKGLKEWIKNTLKALSSLPGRLRVKAVEALPGIIGAILSWILNKAADVDGSVSQNLWALVVGTGELLYTYMVTKKYEFCYDVSQYNSMSEVQQNSFNANHAQSDKC